MTQDLAPGTLIRDTYRILNFIGDGGAGAVYVAEHENLGHRVAVKTLFGKLVRDPDMRQRFIEEAIIQANLSHPNIVKVTDVLDEPPLCAIIMEYVEGGSLDKHLSRRGSVMPVQESARLMVAMLEAVEYAHANGVVHRDIKPANVLLAGPNRDIPKLTDFGIAKVLSDNARTETGTAMGTVYYASPEQLTDAKSVDHRCDIYSLGCTFYEMLTGALPFSEDTMFAVMRKHLQAPRPDPSRLNENVPREVAALVMRAMAVNRDHRFDSCAEFSAELRRVCDLDGPNVSSKLLAAGFDETAQGDALGFAGTTDVPIIRHGTGAPNGTSRTTRRSAPGRKGLSRSTHPGRIDAPPRTRKTSNSVATLMWVAIVALALGLLAMVILGARDEDKDDAQVIAAANAAATAQTAPAEVIAPAVPPETDREDPVAEEAGSGAAAPAADTPAQCIELSNAYVYFDAHEVDLHAALADLDSRADACRRMLERNAQDDFESRLAFMSSIQAQMTIHLLRAVVAQQEGDPEFCAEAQTAITQGHLGLRQIGNAPRDGMLEYEIDSLRPYQIRMTHLYVQARRRFRSCDLAEIPDELLGPEGLMPDPEPPPQDGDKPVVEDVWPQ